ncbi:MAG: carbamoyltransferase HypF [Balneolaceae bacterium]|nr:MAG: carbamoyltransferase HypF [Balneolaceae bacterium]
MHTYHIHTTGMVQGVGFRPMVCDVALRRGLRGWVRNSMAGLEIRFNATEQEAGAFHDEIVRNAPMHAIISGSTIVRVDDEAFHSFGISTSTGDRNPEVLMPPDVALCEACRADLNNPGNRRYRYPFTTCLHCGPRYSIIRSLPYDRAGTTMDELPVCGACADEYARPGDRRQHSQTNSCPSCAITMHAYGRDGLLSTIGQDEIMALITGSLFRGEIVAVKGVGGYLLLADATNASSIKTLRDRKNRPNKPFALMYPDVAMARNDARIGPHEEQALLSAEAPVVLCIANDVRATGIHPGLIAPGLDTLGIMMPYSPLFYLLVQGIGKPLIATSANLSGSPIIYRDDDAILNLKELADLIITFDREITAPQDDSVLRFSPAGQRIILRRSRGMAPCYYPNPFLQEAYSDELNASGMFDTRSGIFNTRQSGSNVDGPFVEGKSGRVTSTSEVAMETAAELASGLLAMGADLKSAFAVIAGKNLFVSQYLGNQDSYDSRCAFRHTLGHIKQLYRFRPQTILTDVHPGYFVTELAEELAAESNISLEKIQHHEAHFAAVLAENGLLMGRETVLGIIWDGTGYGSDGQVWGGEILLKTAGGFSRTGHLDYFPVLAGDKMSREPRLSAFSLLRDFPEALSLLRPRFNNREWDYYNKVLEYGPGLMTSSMGRLFDGIASILDICHLNTYEGEAAGRLEALARGHKNTGNEYYTYPFRDGIIHWKPVIEALLKDVQNGVDKARIASKVFRGLSRLVFDISRQTGIRNIAFSGGVFQNALLTGFIVEEKPDDIELFFHRQLSPNDENIGFGQLAHHILTHSPEPVAVGGNHFHE